MAHTHILGDWGTSRLRLYLLADGRLIDERNGPGIGALTDSPATALANALAPWPRPSEVTLCGMASSRNGLLELPYVKAPTDGATWARAARRVQVEGFDVLLATGIQCGDDTAGFDVMRGEDAQVFGATRIAPQLLRGAHCLVLPGTHSKWVELHDGVVMRFRTAMTGELYSLLSKHSILLKPDGPSAGGPEFDAGFASGVERSRAASESLLSALFQTRTSRLLQGRSSEWASGFLSGVLIGYELTTSTRGFAPDAAITLVGETELAALYQRAFKAVGFVVRSLDGAACTLNGLELLREVNRP